MDIQPLKFLKLLSSLQKVVWAFFALLFVTLFLNFLVYVSKATLAPNRLNERRSVKYKEKFPYKAIGENALSLKGALGSCAIPNLESELLLLKDANELNGGFLIGLLKSKEARLSFDGKRHYLTYNDGRLSFSDEKTPLSISAHMRPDQSLLLSVELQLKDSGGDRLIEEKADIVIRAAPPKVLETFLEEVDWGEGISQLTRAQWHLPDKLLEIYGGAEFRDKRGKQRLVIPNRGRDEILFVSEGDRLVYEESMWRLLEREEKTEKHNLAKIVCASPHKMEIEVWEPSGLFSKIIRITPQRQAATKTRIEESFSKAKARTSTTLSVKLDNKNFLLKAGDWLLCTDKGWRLLKNWEEIERLLSYEEIGDLFIFDALEKLQGKSILCGHFFDAFRGQVLDVRMPLAQKKKEMRPNGALRAPVDIETGPNMTGANDEDFDEEQVPQAMPQPPIREAYYKR